jgi:cell division protein FtsZ
LSNTNKTEENNLEVEHSSNGLENFGVEGESSPDLFSSDDDITHTEGLLSEEINENITEDDDLEIPAFLRRQKN